MKKYTKIETLNAREEGSKHNLLENVYRDETVEYLKNLEWVGTEKVDGTNISVVWNGHSVSFNGRTEDAQIPTFLLDRLNEMFSGTTMEEVFEQKFGEKEIILFGEGYGNKIQKGKNYISDGVDFILFDAYVPSSDTWLNRGSLEDIAKYLGIKIVPIVFKGTLDDGVSYVKTKPKSVIAENKEYVMEGIVCKPKFDLYNRSHKRLIVKIKVKDYE